MPERRRGVTRRQVIAVGFTLLGLLIVLGNFSELGVQPAVTTRLTFGVPNLVLELPTALSLILIGVVWLIAGVAALVPRLDRLGNWGLWSGVALILPAILIWAAAGKQTNAASLVGESLRLATPIALGALAGIYAERSGVINIAIEGMMLTGAAFGFAAFAFTGNIWFGVATAVMLGSVMALIHGVLSISLRTDQIISGTVINILAIGVTGYLRRQFIVDSSGGRVTLPQISIPLLSEIPIIGPLFFVGRPIFFTMILLVLLTHVVLFYTRWGLRMRAVGENPKAADTVGINVIRTRYLNLALSGAIAGLGGAWFSLETVGSFDDGMTAGKGFIALAAMIFGKWTPFGAFGGASLFGFSEALGIRFQILNVELFDVPVPTQFLQLLPYLVTMVVLAGLIGRAVGPAAVGKPYDKQ
ncbi:ABC transporter permease [Candidatus Chloroploca sp. M-50]|uniref:ABC transporter permease n=1 Tax=Candidatus Chloroploca mongolica TaxID=2528176 RepID=A0ABS4D4Q5_9CHLR|nr:ABC transporter permease [Candidatus Chloroploca mongolica]MBP1464416.1 ABC transporter permease [Candidatus Chloroploca mongolica]